MPSSSSSKRKSKGRLPAAEKTAAPPLALPEGDPPCLNLAAAEFLETNDKVPETFRRSLVQLALSNMKVANICIGRPVLLTSGNGQEVCTAWPVPGFPGGRIGLSEITQKNLKVVPGDAVRVQPVTGAVLQAEEVEVKRRAKDVCLNADELSASLLRNLDGKVVLPGNILQITFYGRPCNLIVSQVKGTDGILLKMPDTSVFKPTEELSLENFDTSDFDLSVQLDKLLIEDTQGVMSTSTPYKQMDHSMSVNVSIDAVGHGELNSGSTEMSLLGDGVPTFISHSESSEKCVANEEALQTDKTEALGTSQTFYFISSRTKIRFTEPQSKVVEECNLEPKVTYDSIGGLSSQLKIIREIIELPLKQPDLFRHYGRISVK